MDIANFADVDALYTFTEKVDDVIESLKQDSLPLSKWSTQIF